MQTALDTGLQRPDWGQLDVKFMSHCTQEAANPVDLNSIGAKPCGTRLTAGSRLQARVHAAFRAGGVGSRMKQGFRRGLPLPTRTVDNFVDGFWTDAPKP